MMISFPTHGRDVAIWVNPQQVTHIEQIAAGEGPRAKIWFVGGTSTEVDVSAQNAAAQLNTHLK